MSGKKGTIKNTSDLEGKISELEKENQLLIESADAYKARISELEKKLDQIKDHLQNVEEEYRHESNERTKARNELIELNNKLEESRRAIFEDANRLLKLNEKLAESEYKLKEANAAKDKFISILAHDLLNPLQIILLASEFLIKGKIRSKEMLQEEYLNIFDTAKHLSVLIDNLLQWARAQNGRLAHSPELVSLDMIVSENFTLLSTAAAQKNISLDSKVRNNTIVYADARMLNTILRNLVSNAIKFTNNGGSIVVSSKNKKTYVEITVADTGIGLSKEDINKLFRIDVHTTKIGSSKEKGTGLGLIICKEFVELNNGIIWAESEEGKGSEFKFTMPCNPE